MRSRSNGGVIGAYALPTQNHANGVFFIHDAAIYNTGLNPIWPLASGLIYNATGGTISLAADNSNYRVHTFTSNSTFTIVDGAAELEILIVGGGGSGGGTYLSSSTTINHTGGGGSGGVVTLVRTFAKSGTIFQVEVGQGGVGLGVSSPTSNGNQGLGKPSKAISNVGHNYYSEGGGYGGSRTSANWYDPGNGGGAYNSSNFSAEHFGGAANPIGSGTPGTIISNTFVGGAARNLTDSGCELGGGGSGAIGPGYDNDYSFDPTKAGNGADGFLYARTGYYYGGGGGGGAAGTGWNSGDELAYRDLVGRGGLQGSTIAGSGGHAHTNPSSASGENGANGFGGGGGGSCINAFNSIATTRLSGAGGSGTVIFCYRYK